MTTLEFGQFEHVFVFVCGTVPLDDGEWKTYLTYVAKNMNRQGPNRSLVIAPGAPLNSTQRKALATTIAPIKDLKSAVITESALVRGIITALEWFHRDIFRVFAPAELERALEFLNLNAAQAKRVSALAAELQKKLARSGASQVA